MSLFFSLLCTDLQIEVLSTWLDYGDSGFSLIHVLSALDVACSKLHRNSYRTLLSQLPPFGAYCPTATAKPTYDMVDCMVWLEVRKLAVKSLLLNDSLQAKPTVHLPSVETIVWKGQYALSHNALVGVLRKCPNTTSLECADVATSKKWDVAVHWVDKLKAVSIPSASCPPMELLKAIAPQLCELRMRNCLLTQPFADLLCTGTGCPLLQALEIFVDSHGWTKLVEILQVCSLLTEMSLSVTADVALTAANLRLRYAFKQVQTLVIHTSCYSNQNFTLLASLLQVRSDFKCLQVGDCSFSSQQQQGALRLTHTKLDTALMTNMLNFCSSVCVLDIPEIYLQTDVAEVIANRIGSSLVTLKVCSPFKEALEALIGACRLLKSLEVHGAGVCDELLHLLSRSCPYLETIAVVPNLVTDSITDQGMAELFGGCRHISQLVLHMTASTTVKTLQAIVIHNLSDCNGPNASSLKLILPGFVTNPKSISCCQCRRLWSKRGLLKKIGDTTWRGSRVEN